MRGKNTIIAAAAGLALACTGPQVPSSDGVARLSGTLMVPAELGTSFRVQAVASGAEVPGVAALMVLATPEGKLVSFGGETRIATTVDAAGSFSFPQPLPVGRPLLVTALLPDNKRLAGFTVTTAGENRVEVSLASTFAAHLLSRKAREASASLLAFSPARLAEITLLNRDLLKAGKLPLPDLTIGEDDEVSHAYVASLPAWPRELDRAWAALLGRPLVAATTAAIFPTGVGPHAVAVAANGQLFWATSSRLYQQVGPGAALEHIGGAPGLIPEGEPIPADGTPARAARFNWVTRLAVDPAGNLLLLLPYRRAVACLCRKSGTYWGVAMTEGAFYRVAGTGTQAGVVEGGTYTGDGGPARQATFVGTNEIALDAAGNLFVLDNLVQPLARVRRIDRQTGTILSGPELTLGPAVTLAARPAPAATPVPREDAVEPNTKGPRALALREVDGVQDFLFADVMRNGIGRVRLAPGRSPETALLAGNGASGFAGDGGPAVDAALGLVRPDGDEEGAAFDAARDRYYFFDTENQRIRMVDLKTGTIHTAVGGGARHADGEASSLRPINIGQLAVAPDGDLYYVDRIRDAGVRVMLGERP